MGFTIRAGSTRTSAGGQTRNIDGIIWNNNAGFEYNDVTLENDYVILKLDSPSDFDENVQPACLPSSSDYLDINSNNDKCWTSGWGLLNANWIDYDYGPAPEVCQYVKLNAISNSECSDFYGGNSIADSVICAGDDTSDEGVCFGDSGGPLVCNENGKAVLVGVTSFTAGQHCADLPSGYARVTHVLDWIKESLDSTAPPPQPEECASPQWATDGFCDDENNNEGCNFDGGACCAPYADSWDMFCTECKCKEDSKPPPEESCELPIFEGDGYCDDGNNNKGCNYDGGDCCTSTPPPISWDVFCTACECVEEVTPTQPPCEDEGSAKFCKKLNKKKCKKAKFYKQCKKTCNKCDEGPEPCEDTGSKKQCKKANAKTCKKAKIAKKCKKTCGKC